MVQKRAVHSANIFIALSPFPSVGKGKVARQNQNKSFPLFSPRIIGNVASPRSSWLVTRNLREREERNGWNKSGHAAQRTRDSPNGNIFYIKKSKKKNKSTTSSTYIVVHLHSVQKSQKLTGFLHGWISCMEWISELSHLSFRRTETHSSGGRGLFIHVTCPERTGKGKKTFFGEIKRCGFCERLEPVNCPDPGPFSSRRKRAVRLLTQKNMQQQQLFWKHPGQQHYILILCISRQKKVIGQYPAWNTVKWPNESYTHGSF